SIGLPGIWVLAAVSIGGGLLGIPGMLIGVPLTATVYKWIRMDVGAKLQAEAEMTQEQKNEKNSQ
ncbi:MAG: AI-2E family transporter, partial [Lachnospiraceae bacterium]|nr:AI-2E family transporter [Lachnospiraceae bacterium]